jgi:hypothetical protein
MIYFPSFSTMDLLSKLMDGDFLLRVLAQNYISKIYAILHGNQDSVNYFSFRNFISLIYFSY